MRSTKIVLVIGALCALSVDAYPEQGKWNLTASVNHSYVAVTKSLFRNSHIYLKVMCESEAPTMVTIKWVLRKTPCGRHIIDNTATISFLESVFNNPNLLMPGEDAVGSKVSPPVTVACDSNIILKYSNGTVESSVDAAAEAQEIQDRTTEESGDSKPIQRAKRSEVTNSSLATKNHLITDVPADGVYLFLVHITAVNMSEFKAYLSIEMKGDYGYLSAADWPLLGFYSAMCVVYVVYGLMWLIVSFMQWRDLLRVQYWIGAVIFLGMLEKAMFTAEYESVNTRGISVPGLIVVAELVSCAKRTLARMLVIIVSLGFGIVKPRLGAVLHRVVGVGLLYFILASIESCMRALQPKYNPPKEEFLASVPLAVLDSAMCWWIFSALLQTTRTLRLRRNTVKLSLYRHFTNTLAFAVIASVIFILWYLRYHRQDECLRDWMEVWVDDAYWHLLFALILLVIMVLWRPTNNNQRFAFSPLLDEGSDEEEEEEEKLMADVSDTMKQRNIRPPSSPKESQSVEDDLKWVEENIPSTIADSALPLLDSDEEIVNTKFEMSKME